MYDFGYQKKQVGDTIPHDANEKRNGRERRKEPACGFTYISTVGWICRREQLRRENDPEAFVKQ